MNSSGPVRQVRISKAASARWIMRALGRFIASQVKLSQGFDRLLPAALRIDGSKDFKQQIVPGYLRPGLIIYDIGGGARPCVEVETKRRLRLRLVGLDIDKQQLAEAPSGLYDRTIVADIAAYEERHAADLVVCKSTLEHVADTEAAIATMARLLKPGGTLLLCTASRNAPYARLNRVLPERLKCRLLRTFMPQQADHLGFPASYNHCTPRQFRQFIGRQGLELTDLRLYYITSYFSVIFPIYVLWRVWIIAVRAISPEYAAETFVLIGRKPQTTVSSCS